MSFNTALLVHALYIPILSKPRWLSSYSGIPFADYHKRNVYACKSNLFCLSETHMYTMWNPFNQCYLTAKRNGFDSLLCFCKSRVRIPLGFIFFALPKNFFGAKYCINWKIKNDENIFWFLCTLTHIHICRCPISI